MLSVALLCLLCVHSTVCGTLDRGMNVLTTEEMEQDGWKMVFRGTSGNGYSVFQAWTSGEYDICSDDEKANALNDYFVYVTDIDESRINTNPDKPRSMKRSGGFHYRDVIVKNWSNLDIKRVKFSLYDTDKEVAYVIFNGRDSDITNWFSKTRVLDSSYSDLTSTSVYNIFSIQGHAGSTLQRRFFINKNYGGCPNDRGHIIAIDAPAPSSAACLFDDQPSSPTFIYSKFNSVDYFNKRMFNVADFLVIFIQI